MAAPSSKPDYGVDAPAVLRNLLLIGGVLLVTGVVMPRSIPVGSVIVEMRASCLWTGGILFGEGLLFLLYVKLGKFRHRDFMLGLHPWRGDEQVLDVGCGRGLLLAGAAKRLAAHAGSGRAAGIDLWSNVDMGGNSAAATERTLELEGVADRCTLVTGSAVEMPFPDASFDVVLSNLCLHNIPAAAMRAQAVREIARVLRPGGLVLLSDYRRTKDYARELRSLGFHVERRWGSVLTTFPPLRVVIATRAGRE